jgi:hypothetical protein
LQVGCYNFRGSQAQRLKGAKPSEPVSLCASEPLLQRLQLLRRVRRRIHFRVRLRDLSFLIDHVCDAAGVFVFLRFGGAVGEADFACGVAEEWEGKLELFGEAFVFGGRVETDAENLRVLRGVLGLEVPEPGTFARSTGCLGLGVEPEHDLFSAQVAEANGVAVVIAELEVGSFIADLEHACFSSGQGSDDAAYRHVRNCTRGGYFIHSKTR